jgi:hypothetical protein
MISRYLPTRSYSIIGQRLSHGGDIVSILKTVVATAIALVLLLAFITTLIGTPVNALAYTVIALGVALLILSLLSNIMHQSRIKIGAINRGEFYSVVAIIMGWLFLLTNRIDSLYQIMINMK